LAIPSKIVACYNGKRDEVFYSELCESIPPAYRAHGRCYAAQ